jgi:hypothetical protein
LTGLLTDVLTRDLILAAAICGLGGFMHGYTGWGGGMVMMPLMTPIYGPVQALALIIVGGIMSSLQLLPAAVRGVHWIRMRWVYLALLIATPLGSLALVHLDPSIVRRVIGVIVVAAALAILFGWQYRGRRDPAASTAFGAVSGFFNGFAGVGGPALVIYVLAHPDSARVQRAGIVIGSAIMIALIMATLAATGSIGWVTLLKSILLGPPQMAGAWLGMRLFRIAPQEIFRRVTLIALVGLGLGTLIF